MDISQAHGGDVVNIANYLLNDLKNSYQIWEELISKCTKFHSALKVATQASSAFLDTFQKVADLATKTLGGSKEIGACLTRYCMRQKSLESKVKSMGNHLVTSLANPLNSKVDEWKRNLCQLEKDRTRQTKRVRAELKKALSEAQKWEKKAAKVGVTGGSGVGPGVGHGIIPHAKHMCSNSESNAISLQTAKAAREVGIKKELVENTEKSAMRLLLLEERSRFCFFVSCLLPILECQSSMLHEIATMDELIKTLTKETEFPDQLVEDVESIVLRMGRRDFSASRGSSKIMSVFVPDGGDRINNINEVLGGLLMTNGNRNYVNSSDTESGRHGADMLSPYQICRDLETVGRCNSVCDSADISLCGASSHSGSGGSNCPSLLSPARSNVAHLGSRESSLISVDSAASGSGNANSTYSIGMSNTNIPHSDPGETQFKTLCRPGHYRTASNGDNDFSKNYLKNGFHHDKIDSYMVAKSMIAFSEQSQLTDSNNNDDNITTNGQNYALRKDDDNEVENIKMTDNESKLEMSTDDDENHDDSNDDDVGDGGEYVEVGSDSGNAPAHLSNNPTSPSLSNSANQHFLLENYPPITATTTDTTGDPPIPNSGRHTISSAYERGGHAPARASITALSFNPPDSINKLDLNDSAVSQSYHDEEKKYANPSTVLKSQVNKLAISTSLSNSCHNSKNCLDSVSMSDATSTNNPTSVVGNNDIHSYQRSGTDPFSMEMDELDQVMPVNNGHTMTLNRMFSKCLHNQLTGTLPSHPRYLSIRAHVSSVNSCLCVTNATELLGCNEQNSFASCYHHNNESISEPVVNVNCGQSFFTPQSFVQKKLLGEENHNRHSLHLSPSESKAEKVIGNKVDHNDHLPSNHSLIVQQTSCSPINSLVSPSADNRSPPPPIQPKPVHLKHHQAISQYHINRKTAPRMSRPCPPPRTCSTLSSHGCLAMTSGVSMPCDLNMPDPSPSSLDCKISFCEDDNYCEGSSRGSSLTMASSTTNDSLPSSNGSPALTSYNSNQNSTQRSFSSNSNPVTSNEQQILENKLHYATPVIRNQSQCSTTPGQVFNPLIQSTLASNQVCMNTVCVTTGIPNGNVPTPPPPPPPPPPPLPMFSPVSPNKLSTPHPSLEEITCPKSTNYDENLATDLVSVETANLMSELSSQLQQLAARSNDVNFSQSTYKSRDIFHKEPIKHDDFDLPPPPPPSMFTEQYCSDVVKSECSPIQNTNISCNSTTSIIVNDNNNNTDEVSDDNSNKNLSPFLLALKQSVKQRADRLAAGNSTNNRT
ncbi:unnamed protein product [Schistosoma rodhaini]|uniref:IMD domain-containing protein n=1 Tax=Schistosoma rodhaini TaxID=6188 RepID=A0AA85EQ75_9TREM|nr:unnamed protein product [Schistosoma rodhaini]CAH8682084.1 unnamed protein product [Schistosoma rodhaini]